MYYPEFDDLQREAASYLTVELKGFGLHCLSSLLALISYETQKQIFNFLLRSMC